VRAFIQPVELNNESKLHYNLFKKVKNKQCTFEFKISFDSRFYSPQATFNPEGTAEVSQIFFRHTHAPPKLVSCELYCRRDRR
jgi:hypothetical protein